MEGRPRVGVSRVVLSLALVVVVAVAGIAGYYALTTLARPPSSTSSASGPTVVIGMSPASPIIAPGQVQNYSTLELSAAGGAVIGGAVALEAFAPAGISLELNQTSVSLASNPQSVPVQLRAGPGIAPGGYPVTIEARPSSAEAVNATFTVEVVPALVVMQGEAFLPQNLTVAKGTQVTWLNLDSTIGCCDPGAHDVSFLTGANFTSSVITRLETVNYTFGSDGTFDYYCTIHVFMKGQVKVVG